MANIKEPREPGAYNKKGTQFLSELKVHSQALLQEVGCVEQADQVSNELVQRVAELWGGQLIYIGQGYEFKATQRDQQIYAEFNGHNHSELAQKFHIGVSYVYKIVKRMMAYEKKRNQPDLFGND